MLAAIDVGSNTVRMLIGKVVDGKVIPERYERKITRLKGQQTAKGLAPASMERTLSALRDLIDISSRYNLSAMQIVGTEALRSAVNGRQFAEKVHDSLGVELQIINGQTEARLSAAGVLSVVDPVPERCVIVDIGGGSTEIVVVDRSEVVFSESLTLGVVQLAEINSRDAGEALLLGATGQIRDQLATAGLLDLAADPATALIGTAGTMTTLAAIDMEMASYDWRRVNNHRISAERVGDILSRLQPLTPQEREKVAGMEAGRGDLIIPGIQILQRLMSTLAKKTFVVSDFGLLEGLLLQLSKSSAIH